MTKGKLIVITVWVVFGAILFMGFDAAMDKQAEIDCRNGVDAVCKV